MKKIEEYPSSSLAASSMKGFLSTTFAGLPRPLLLRNISVSMDDGEDARHDIRGRSFGGAFRGSLSRRWSGFGGHDGKKERL